MTENRWPSWQTSKPDGDLKAKIHAVTHALHQMTLWQAVQKACKANHSCEGSQDMSIRIRESVRFIWSWPFQEMCWFSHSPFSQSSFYRIPPSLPALPTFPWLIALPAPPKLYNPSLPVFGSTGGLVCCWCVNWRPSCSIKLNINVVTHTGCQCSASFSKSKRVCTTSQIGKLYICTLKLYAFYRDSLIHMEL